MLNGEEISEKMRLLIAMYIIILLLTDMNSLSDRLMSVMLRMLVLTIASDKNKAKPLSDVEGHCSGSEPVIHGMYSNAEILRRRAGFCPGLC